MKFSFTKNPESEVFFIENPNLTEKQLFVCGGGEGGKGVE